MLNSPIKLSRYDVMRDSLIVKVSQNYPWYIIDSNSKVRLQQIQDNNNSDIEPNNLCAFSYYMQDVIFTSIAADASLFVMDGRDSLFLLNVSDTVKFRHFTIFFLL